MLYDTHMHTPLCKHARGLPYEYAEAAEQRGLDGIIMTCHNPMPEDYSPNVRMSAGQLSEYLAMVEDARRKMAGRVDVRLGLECDYLPEFEPWLERQLAGGTFEYVLGSVHPHLRDYKARYPRESSMQFQRQYFDHLAAAAETRLFHTLAHPDLVKKVELEHWQPEAILDHVKRCLDRIAAAGVAMEVNTGGRRNAELPECYPGLPILREMRERDIAVVIGSDAHDPHRVGEGFTDAVALLRDAGYTHTALPLGDERHSIPLDDWARLRPIEDEAAK